MSSSTITSPSSSQTPPSPPPSLQIVFVHLDLGIGGAEQLVLNLAEASLDAGHDVHLVTANCRQDHCFDVVKRPNGKLSDRVHVWGSFLPSSILNMGGTALCSSIRLLWLSFWVTRIFAKADLVVLDVLPTPIPILLPYMSVLFYCHFPDKLLTRDTVNGEAIVVEGSQAQQQQQAASTMASPLILFLKQWYRSVLDYVEEVTMGLADLLVVNSNFTRTQIQHVMPSLQHTPMRVLYPAISCGNDNDDDKDDTLNENTTETTTTTTPSPSHVSNNKTSTSPIVSLNRYERKKNIELVLQAYASLLKQESNCGNSDAIDSSKDDEGANITLSSSSSLPPLIVAGGYDFANVENVEYMGELQSLAHNANIHNNVTFLKSISDEVRGELLQDALCVVYTPHLEHFGIVPLEAMAAATPVVAVDSGGPKETIVDGVTGFLCPTTPDAFCRALQKFVTNPSLATQMGKAGKHHVQTNFSQAKFQKEWTTLVNDAIHKGKERRLLRRRIPTYALSKGLLYVLEALLVLSCVVLLTQALRTVGIVEKDAYIVGSIKRALFDSNDEL